MKNHVGRTSSILEAITFDSIVRISIYLVFRKLKVHTFPRTARSAQSESGKAFKCAMKFRIEKLEDDKIADISPVAPKGALGTFLPLKCLKCLLPDQILIGMNFGVLGHIF